MEARINLDRMVLAVDHGDTVHLLVELAAPPLTVERPRPPLDLAVVLDRSGSMSGEPIDGVKQATELLGRLLGPDDRMSLVSFDSDVTLDLPLEQHSSDTIAQAVAVLDAGSATNLSGGWLKGVEVLDRGRDDASRKVVLLTDGHANVGILVHDELGSLAADVARRGIGTTTIGYGVDFDEELLQVLATSGRGNAYFADGPEEAPGIFAAEFDGLSSIVAQNVSIEIRPAPEVRLVGVLNDYPATPVEGGLQLAMGDAYAEETRTLVAALSVPGLASLGPTVIAELVLRYALVGEQVELHTVTIPVEVNVASESDAAAVAPDARVVEEVLILRAARARRDARRATNDGDIGEARNILGRTVDELRLRAPDAADPARVAAQADEIEADAAGIADAASRLYASKSMWASERQAMRTRPSRTAPSGAGRRPRRPRRPSGSDPSAP